MSEQPILQPTSEQIARTAYLMWEREGRPQGRDVTHWLQAELQLKASGIRDGKAVRRSGATARTVASKRARAARRPKSERSDTVVD